MADGADEHVPLVSCEGLFTDVEYLSETELELIELGGCLNPKLTTVQGTQVFSEEWKQQYLKFDQDLLGDDIYLYMFYSYNIFDH